MALKRLVLSVAGALVVGLTASAARPGHYTPPRYEGGAAPPNQVAAVGGGEVFVQVELSEGGAVTNVLPLRITPPFTEPTIETVRRWRFRPAIQEMLPEPDEVPQTIAQNLVKSKVFVAAFFRAPALAGPTLGAEPSDVGTAAGDMSYAMSTALPNYPVNMRMDGTVVVEVHVDTNGSTRETRIVQSTPGFDGPALSAAANWSFRPARVNGALTDSYAYICFGFRAPVAIPSRSGLAAPTPTLTRIGE